MSVRKDVDIPAFVEPVEERAAERQVGLRKRRLKHPWRFAVILTAFAAVLAAATVGVVRVENSAVHHRAVSPPTVAASVPTTPTQIATMPMPVEPPTAAPVPAESSVPVGGSALATTNGPGKCLLVSEEYCPAVPVPLPGHPLLDVGFIGIQEGAPIFMPSDGKVFITSKPNMAMIVSDNGTWLVQPVSDINQTATHRGDKVGVVGTSGIRGILPDGSMGRYGLGVALPYNEEPKGTELLGPFLRK